MSMEVIIDGHGSAVPKAKPSFQTNEEEQNKLRKEHVEKNKSTNTDADEDNNDNSAQIVNDEVNNGSPAQIVNEEVNNESPAQIGNAENNNEKATESTRKKFFADEIKRQR